MADTKVKGKKPDKEPKVPKHAKASHDANKGNKKGDSNAHKQTATKVATKAGLAAALKVDPGAQKADSHKQSVKLDPKAQKLETTPGTDDKKRSKLLKTPLSNDVNGSGKRNTIRGEEPAPENAAEAGVIKFVPEPGKVYMYDAQGKVMVDEEGSPYPGLKMWDIDGNTILNKKGNPIPGRFQYTEEGNIFLDAEGYPFLERQETTKEKQDRLAREESRRKMKTLREKVEAEREMMTTPLPIKPVKWRKYCNTMYLPRSLKTAILKDRGTPGDDWRNYVKKYTLEEMNHKLAYQLHGRAGILWRKLHSHITYLQNPRYASENPKHIKALRIFHLEDTAKGKDWVLLDPPVAFFDGFGELASTTI